MRAQGGTLPCRPAPLAAGRAQATVSTVAGLDFRPGDLIADRYRIVRKISEGGMGIVYLAQHALIERHVAIKILSPEFASAEDGTERFLREARAAAKVVHENIIAV